MSFLIIKKKKRESKIHTHNKNAQTKYIDFDNVEETWDRFENNKKFPMEEDIVNAGTWILLFHPNFFQGSSKANWRYLFWLLNALITLAIQGLFVLTFFVTSFNERNEPLKSRLRLEQKASTVQLYNDWFEAIRNATDSKNETVI